VEAWERIVQDCAGERTAKVSSRWTSRTRSKCSSSFRRSARLPSWWFVSVVVDRRV